MIRHFDEMKTKLAAGPTRRVAVAAADDAHTLEAVLQAVKNGIIEPILLGDRKETEAILAKMGGAPNTLRIDDVKEPHKCAEAAVRMAKDGEVDCIMKGRIDTSVMLRTLLDGEKGIRKREMLSGFGLFETGYYHKMFAITDLSLNLYPTLAQKKTILENALDVFHALGVERPKVAVIAAVEKANPKMPETVEAEALAQMAATGELPGCAIAGPISVDLALNPHSAVVKRYENPVAGDADILLAPNITAGNIAAKMIESVGGARSCGMIIGAKVPVIVLSRAAPTDDKYMSIILSALVGAN